MYEQWGEAPFINPAHAGGEASFSGEFATGEFGSGEFGSGEFSTELGESAFVTPEASAEAHASVDRWAETLGEQPWGHGPIGASGEAEWSGEDEFGEAGFGETIGEAAFGEFEMHEMSSVGEDEWGEFVGETAGLGEWNESELAGESESTSPSPHRRRV